MVTKLTGFGVPGRVIVFRLSGRHTVATIRLSRPFAAGQVCIAVHFTLAPLDEKKYFPYILKKAVFR